MNENEFLLKKIDYFKMLEREPLLLMIMFTTLNKNETHSEEQIEEFKRIMKDPTNEKELVYAIATFNLFYDITKIATIAASNPKRIKTVPLEENDFINFAIGVTNTLADGEDLEKYLNDIKDKYNIAKLMYTMAILPAYSADSSGELMSYIERKIHLDFSKEEDLEKFRTYNEESKKIVTGMKNGNNVVFSDLTDEQFEEYISQASELHKLCEDGIEKEEDFARNLLLKILSDALTDEVEEEKIK